jgi:hypothetical protein
MPLTTRLVILLLFLQKRVKGFAHFFAPVYYIGFVFSANYSQALAKTLCKVTKNF